MFMLQLVLSVCLDAQEKTRFPQKVRQLLFKGSLANVHELLKESKGSVKV